MASICGGSLALMNAGVPILSPVAGVAMGLVCNSTDNADLKEDNYKILTDISVIIYFIIIDIQLYIIYNIKRLIFDFLYNQGIEDHLGDMDFKIAGTKKGFTAFQADIKIPGIPFNVIIKTIQNAHLAKNQIINIMNKVISSPTNNKKTNKPVLDTIEIPIHQRRKFLGIGGLNIKKIFDETGVNVNSKKKKIEID